MCRPVTLHKSENHMKKQQIALRLGVIVIMLGLFGCPLLPFAPHASKVNAWVSGSPKVSILNSIGSDLIDSTIDSADNTYLLFNLTSPISIGTFTATSTVVNGQGNCDVVVLAIDAEGNFKWGFHPTFTGSFCATSIATKNSRVVIAGSFRGHILMGGSDYPASNAHDAFVMSLDTSGQYIWTSTFGGYSEETLNAMALSADGQIVVTGNFSARITIGSQVLQTHGSSDDVFVVDINVDGTISWAKSYGGVGVDIGTSVAVNASGDVFIAGYFGTAYTQPEPASYSISFDIQTASVAGRRFDGYVAKLSSSGTVSWVKTLGGNGSNSVKELLIAPNDDLFVLSQVSSTSSIAGQSMLSVSGLVVTPFVGDVISKVDTDGNFLWNFPSHPAVNRIITNTSSDIFALGLVNCFTSDCTKLGVDVAPQSVTYRMDLPGLTQASGHHSENNFVFKINSSGAIQWTRMYNGITHAQGTISSVGNLVLFGATVENFWTSVGDPKISLGSYCKSPCRIDGSDYVTNLFLRTDCYSQPCADYSQYFKPGFFLAQLNTSDASSIFSPTTTSLSTTTITTIPLADCNIFNASRLPLPDYGRQIVFQVGSDGLSYSDMDALRDWDQHKFETVIASSLSWFGSCSYAWVIPDSSINPKPVMVWAAEVDLDQAKYAVLQVLRAENPLPTTTTSVAPVSTTSVAPVSTTSVALTATSVLLPITSTPTTARSLAVPVQAKSFVLKISHVVSQSEILKYEKIVIKSTYKVRTVISTISRSYCKMQGLNIKALKNGSCTMSVTVKSQNGKVTVHIVKFRIIH